MSLETGLQTMQQKLSELTDQPRSRVFSTLEEVESALHLAKEDLTSVTAKATPAAGKVRAALGVLNQSLAAWRQHYPDVSPIRIDNRKCSYAS